MAWDNTPIHAAAGGSRPGNCATAVGCPHSAPCLGHAVPKFSPMGLQWIVDERIKGILIYSPTSKGFYICFKCFSPVAFNRVRNRDKQSLHFENIGVKSQSFKNEGKNTIRAAVGV